MKEIIIKVSKDGKVSVDFNGFVGKECFAERTRLEEILRRLGIDTKVEEEVKKPEAYVEQEAYVMEVERA